MANGFSTARKLTYGAVCTALSLLALVLAGVLPTMRLACYFISALFVYVLSRERLYGEACICFLAVCALSLLLLPDKLTALPYAALLGHFGIFKPAADNRFGQKPAGFILCVLYCDVFFALGVFVAVRLFDFDAASLSRYAVPVWALAAACQLALILFVWLYGVCQRVYERRFRNLLLK